MCIVFDGEITGVQLRIQNALICVGLKKTWQRIAATAAGPFCSLALGLCYPWLPKLALSGLIQGVFNLLPVFPLDGGRILRELLLCMFPEKEVKKFEFASTIVVVLLLIFLFFGIG